MSYGFGHEAADEDTEPRPSNVPKAEVDPVAAGACTLKFTKGCSLAPLCCPDRSKVFQDVISLAEQRCSGEDHGVLTLRQIIGATLRGYCGMASKKIAPSSSTPPWVATVGALVAISGAAYAWYSHFNPKPEPVKPVTAPSAPAVIAPQVAASVTVSGPGIGVGYMSGGTISVSPGPMKPESAASASKSVK